MEKRSTIIERVLKAYCVLNNLDYASAETAYKSYLAHYRGSKEGRVATEREMDLQELWYQQIEVDGTADYSVYDHDLYFADLAACYNVYSYDYIQMIAKLGLEGIDRVLDLGCGLGLTSRHLQLALNADVVATNIRGTKQYAFCEKVGINIEGDHNKFDDKKIDCVFASEYLEHIEDAPDHLNEVLEVHRPRYMIMANAFGARSVGHFPQFYNSCFSSKAYPCDTQVDAKRMGRLVSYIMKANNYKPVATGFWNNRPQVWQCIQYT